MTNFRPFILVPIWAFMLSSTQLCAQSSAVDSLVKVMNTTKDDRQKTQLLHRIVSSLWDFDFDRAHSFGQQELQLANKIKDPEAQAIALTDVGMYYYFVGNYPEATRYYQQALDAAGDQNFGEFPAYTYTRIGNLYRVQGEFDSAQVNYEKSIKLLEGSAPGISLASVYFHTGWLHHELSRFKLSLEYLHKARTIRNKIGDSLLIAECWRVIGTSHLELSNMDSAAYYLNKVRALAGRYGDTELFILTSINLGDYFLAHGQAIEAIRSYESALDSLVVHDFKRYRALSLMQIGKVYESRSDYLRAIDYYIESLRLNEELNSRQQIARVYGNMGWSHNSLNNFVQADEQARKSLSMMRQIKDKAGEAFAYNLLGNIAFNRKLYGKAEELYDSALQLRKELQLDEQVSNTMFNLARVYERLGRYDDALRYYLSDLEVVARLKDQRVLALSYNNIGWLYALKRDFSNAEKHLKEGQRLSLLLEQPVYLRDNYLNFARLYKLTGRTAESNTYFEKYIALNDSLQIHENALAAQQRDALYQLEKKNLEIQSLNARDQVREQEIKSQNAKIYLQNTILGLIVVALALISVVAIVLYRSYRLKLKANEELSKLNRAIHEQKEEIEAQTEELTEANQTIQAINRNLEASVEDRTQQLKQAYTELDTFIYRSSHDLRRPLTTFMGLTEVARISVKDQAALELFYKVNDTAQNLDRMLAKLQSVSLIASTELAPAEISFEHELDYALSRYGEEILDKRIRVERSVKALKSFVSYPAILRVILENLLENAIQFSLRNPVIKVDISQTGTSVSIRVEDNGEGIPEEFRNRLYEMYFRASERSKGNGLGLYLVRKAAQRLKGDVQFVPNVPQGAVFTVSIPSL
jgi:signal transduction histidine kinase